MLDRVEQEIWFEVYLKSASATAGGRADPEGAMKWARSMAKVAEQFAPNDDEEPVDA
jgi:hypothetical protein